MTIINNTRIYVLIFYFFYTSIFILLHTNNFFLNYIHTNIYTISLLFYAMFILFLFCIANIHRKFDNIVTILFLFSLIFKSLYVFSAPYNITIHDVGKFAGFSSNEISWGHFGYIEYISKHFHLPDFDPRKYWSFTNPPLFHIVCAVFLYILKSMHINEDLCYECLQLIPLLFTHFAIIYSYKIICCFVTEKCIQILFLIIVITHPFFFILSVTLNNDCYVMFFSSCIVFYTLKWLRKTNYKNILLLALSFGLGMLSKINIAVFSIGIGVCFFVLLFKKFNKRYDIIKQFFCFLIIAFPLSMYFPVKNYILFNINFNYVQQVPMPSDQYISGINIFHRIASTNINEILYPFITWNPTIDTNIWINLIKTSLFDIYSSVLLRNQFLSSVTFLLYFVCIFLVIYNIFHLTINLLNNKTMQDIKNVFIFLFFFSCIGFYLYFCIKEQFICTMNFRYIPISFVFMLIFSGQYMQNKAKKFNFFDFMFLSFTYLFSVLSIVIDFSLICCS